VAFVAYLAVTVCVVCVVLLVNCLFNPGSNRLFKVFTDLLYPNVNDSERIGESIALFKMFSRVSRLTFFVFSAFSETTGRTVTSVGQTKEWFKVVLRQLMA
jgi:hypothetical protein